MRSYPEGPDLEFLLRTSYDAAYSLFDAIERQGPHSTAMRDYLYRAERDGAVGKVKFDSNGDIIGLNFILKKIVNGQPKSAG